VKLNSFAVTDIGRKRKINQDSFLKDDPLALYVVADGMGGTVVARWPVSWL